MEIKRKASRLKIFRIIHHRSFWGQALELFKKRLHPPLVFAILNMSWILILELISISSDSGWDDKRAHFPKKQSAPSTQPDAICQSSFQSLKFKVLTDTHIFKVDVGVLGEVWVGVPWSIVCCRAPAVPVLMLSTVCYDTRLQRRTITQTLDWYVSFTAQKLLTAQINPFFMNVSCWPTVFLNSAFFGFSFPIL